MRPPNIGFDVFVTEHDTLLTILVALLSVAIIKSFMMKLIFVPSLWFCEQIMTSCLETILF